MSKPYTNDFQRSQSVGFNVCDYKTWTIEDINSLQEIFLEKGHIVLPVTRVFVFMNNGYRVDALVVNRYSREMIEEYLFTQRIEFYTRAEGSEDVALLFLEQTSAHDILKNIRQLPRGDVL